MTSGDILAEAWGDYWEQEYKNKKAEQERIEGGMMKIHELKTWPEYYQPMEEGIKRFEWRRNDRNFEVGDCLLLKEWTSATGSYTGREQLVYVEYIMGKQHEFGIHNEYVIMSIRKIGFKELTDILLDGKP